MKQYLASKPKLKAIAINLISSKRHPRPRLWIRWLVNPFYHHRGKGATIKRRRSRIDVFPWHKFDVGNDSIIEDFTVINNGAGDIVIGERVIVGIGSVVIGPVEIMDGSTIGQHVFIAGFNHGYQNVSEEVKKQPLNTLKVTIGKETFIGANSVIVAGVSIGEHSVVAAGSAVTKNVPSFCVVAGNPAKIIKKYNEATNSWEKQQ